MNQNQLLKFMMRDSHGKFNSHILFYDTPRRSGILSLHRVESRKPGLAGACFLMLMTLVNKTKIIGL